MVEKIVERTGDLGSGSAEVPQQGLVSSRVSAGLHDVLDGDGAPAGSFHELVLTARAFQRRCDDLGTSTSKMTHVSFLGAK